MAEMPGGRLSMILVRASGRGGPVVVSYVPAAGGGI
jgi:hypothetical protein